MHFPSGKALGAPRSDFFQRIGFLKAAEGGSRLGCGVSWSFEGLLAAPRAQVPLVG